MKRIAYLISVFTFLFYIPSTFASERLLDREQIKTLFSERTMTVTNVNFKQRGQDGPYRVYTTELGAMHRSKDIDDRSVRGWYTDDHDRFCFSRALSNTNRDPKNTCGQIVWDGNRTYHMYRTTDLRQNGNQVGGKKRNELLMIFSNVGKDNQLED